MSYQRKRHCGQVVSANYLSLTLSPAESINLKAKTAAQSCILNWRILLYRRANSIIYSSTETQLSSYMDKLCVGLLLEILLLIQIHKSPILSGS